MEKPYKTNISREDKFPGLLKADLHIHTADDVLDRIDYSSKELIDYMRKQGFEVLAFTFHDQAFYDKKTFDYARKKGILLIPGIEKKIEKAEILIYAGNPKITKETLGIKTLEELRKFRKKHGKNILIIAPHPFFMKSQCIGKKLEKNLDLFDALEYSHFYTGFLNRNNPAVKISEKHRIPMVGNSDIHQLSQVGLTYSRIGAKKNIAGIFEAVRNGRVKVITRPLSAFQFLKIAFYAMITSKKIKARIMHARSKQKAL